MDFQRRQPPKRPSLPKRATTSYSQRRVSSSITIPSHYKYTPLKTPSTQIRLFRILLSSKPGLHCSMTTYPLPCPPGTIYNAISYTWQPERPYQKIRINSRPHRIGFNLWLFLTKLAETGETGLLWADALCIDQGNVEERNSQVAVMSQIYKCAYEVLCWVGGEDWGSEKFLRKAGSRKAMYWRTWTFTEEGVAMWEALSDFGSREYWSRMWIVPEVLSKPQARVVVFCGDGWITLERLHVVCDFALDVLGSRRRKSSRNRENWELPAGWTEDDVAATANDIRNSNMLHLSHKCGHTSLWDLLERHGNAGCSDPRDKVYALLSVAEDAIWLECPLRPDYEKDPRVLITDVLTFCSRENTRSLRQLVAWMLPKEEVPDSFEVWAQRWPASIEVPKIV